MLKKPMRHTVLSVSAVLAASFALAACGSSSSDSTGSSDLARYAPADTLFFADAVVRPEGAVATNVDDIATKLTGSTISEAFTKAIDEQSTFGGAGGEMNFETDINPWLGENIAAFGTADLSQSADALSSGSLPDDAMTADGQIFGIVAESTDETASEAFIQKAIESEDTSESEYEGNTYYTDQGDNSVVGSVDGNVVVASDGTQFEAIVDASNGDSLADSNGFKDVGDKTPSESVFNVYAANEPILKSSSEDQFPGIKDVYTALGIDITDSASQLSMVPGDNEMKVVSVTNTDTTMETGDASNLIATFPADSVFAAGTAGIGENVTKIIDSLDETGIEGILPPGELKKNLADASQGGLDVQKIISSLQEVGFFVSGTTSSNLGGALVVTTDDPEPIKSSLASFSSLIGLADDTKVQPLGGGQTGFLVKTPELPGRPVIIALKDDRLVVAIGRPAANQILNGGGQSLADSTAFKNAETSLGSSSIDAFANAASIATLIGEQKADGSKEAADFFNKFDFMAAGHGSDDNTAEIIASLAD